MRLLMVLIFISMEFIGCSGVRSGREERRVIDEYERTGEVPDDQVEEEISDTVGGVHKILKDINDYLNKCESDMPDIPRTELDVILGAVGFNDANKLAQARECLEQKLEEVTKQICQSKEDIYTQAQRYRNYDQRYERIQNGVDRIEQMHLRHQEWLWTQADRWHDRADRRADSSFLGNEMRAYAEIFSSEATITCPYENRYRS